MPVTKGQKLKTRAASNKKIRTDSIRKQLETQGHLQHVSAICDKLMDLENPLEVTEVQRLRIAAELKMKIVNKYLSDLKSTEIENITPQEQINIQSIQAQLSMMDETGKANIINSTATEVKDGK